MTKIKSSKGTKERFTCSSWRRHRDEAVYCDEDAVRLVRSELPCRPAAEHSAPAAAAAAAHNIAD